jgi:hypothetical protein
VELHLCSPYIHFNNSNNSRWKPNLKAAHSRPSVQGPIAAVPLRAPLQHVHGLSPPSRTADHVVHSLRSDTAMSVPVSVSVWVRKAYRTLRHRSLQLLYRLLRYWTAGNTRGSYRGGTGYCTRTDSFPCFSGIFFRAACWDSAL